MGTAFTGLTHGAVLAELGRRAKAERLNQDLTQATVADRAGLSRQTIAAVERGDDASISSFIAVVAALGRLDDFDVLLAEAPPSPIERLRRVGPSRQRATGAPASPDDAGPWEWGDSK